MATESFLEKCKKFFNEANGGEPLAPADLYHAIRKANPNFKGTNEEIAEMFFDADRNHDQLISWEEFEAAVTKKDHDEVTRAELEALFKDLDTDKSGKLNKQEIKRLCTELELNISDAELDKLIKEADPNGDNEINYDEFLKSWFAK